MKMRQRSKRGSALKRSLKRFRLIMCFKEDLLSRPEEVLEVVLGHYVGQPPSQSSKGAGTGEMLKRIGVKPHVPKKFLEVAILDGITILPYKKIAQRVGVSETIIMRDWVKAPGYAFLVDVINDRFASYLLRTLFPTEPPMKVSEEERAEAVKQFRMEFTEGVVGLSPTAILNFMYEALERGNERAQLYFSLLLVPALYEKGYRCRKTRGGMTTEVFFQKVKQAQGAISESTVERGLRMLDEAVKRLSGGEIDEMNKLITAAKESGNDEHNCKGKRDSAA